MAVATPNRETTQTAAEIVRLLNALPADDQARCLQDLNLAVEKALKERKYRIFVDVLEGWQRLELARRDPNYRKNMARASEPLGETYTLSDLKKRFSA